MTMMVTMVKGHQWSSWQALNLRHVETLQDQHYEWRILFTRLLWSTSLFSSSNPCKDIFTDKCTVQLNHHLAYNMRVKKNKQTNKQTNKCKPLGSATTFPAFGRLIAWSDCTHKWLSATSAGYVWCCLRSDVLLTGHEQVQGCMSGCCVQQKLTWTWKFNK